MRAFTPSFGPVIAISFILPLAALTMQIYGTGYASQYQESEPYAVVSDRELKSFALAYKKIAEIRSDTQSQLRAVQDSEKAKQLQQQAQTEMIRVLENEALTVPRYNEIFAAVQNSEDLRQKVEEIWEGLAEKP